MHRRSLFQRSDLKHQVCNADSKNQCTVNQACVSLCFIRDVLNHQKWYYFLDAFVLN